METLSEVLSLDMTRVHVEVKVVRVASIVGVDVPEERSARACLVRVRVEQHACVDRVAVAVDTVDIVVNEALAGVEFGSGLAVYDEDVAAFDGGAGSASGGYRAEGVFEGKLGRIQTRDETELSDVWLGLGVCGHPYCCVARSDDDVVRKCGGRAGDLCVLV